MRKKQKSEKLALSAIGHTRRLRKEKNQKLIAIGHTQPLRIGIAGEEGRLRKERGKELAMSQIFLLVISIVAISYAIGSEIGVVSGVLSDNVGKQVTVTISGKTGAGTLVGTGNPTYPYAISDGSGNYFDFATGSFAPAGRTGNQFLNNDIVSSSGNSWNLGTGTSAIGLGGNADLGGTNPFGVTNIPAVGTGEQAQIAGLEDVDLSKDIPAVGTGEQAQIAGLEDVDLSKLPPPTAAEIAQTQLKGLEGRHVSIGDQTGTLTKVDGGYSLMDGKECVAGCGNTPLTVGQIAAQGGVEGTFNWGKFGGEILGNLGTALLIYGAIQLFAPILGLESEETKALSEAAALGYFVGSTINSVGSAATKGGFGTGWGTYGTGIGIGVAVVYFLHEYKKEDTRIVQFTCIPWQAPTSGENCEECNTKGLPCSEYQCKALGQGCELVNVGTKEETCVWVNRNDVNPPIMQPWEDALLNDYEYTPDNTISPPDRGVHVDYEKSSDNCAPAFTPLQFGIILDEPAKCKVDTLRKDSFENMDLFISEGLLRYNHTFALTLPGSNNLEGEGIEVENDGNYEVYMRCEDANGNFNIGNFVFKYCIEKGPDTTPPLVISTSIANNMPISFNQSSVDVEFYINEPSECKWSKNDRDYSNMENSMDCDTSIGQANSQGLYTCKTTLTGMKNKFDNEFYIRCKDQPIGVEETSRNVNVESYKYTVKGTQPLVIDSALPEEGDTIKDATDVVKVTFEIETSAGFRDGEATCYYSDTGDEDDFIEFFNTNSHEHSQDLFLTEGSYTYHIKCRDLGGNTDFKTLEFNVESDNDAPIVVRAYHEETFLKLITIEEASCVYDVVDCSYNFDDGIKITSIDDLNHFVDWDIKSNLYIKCRDIFGNEPLPNKCSIITKTTDF